jgi:hypothetical protein
VRYSNCLVPLAFILGDAKSQDTIVGRYGGHNCPRMFRSCDVSLEDSDNPTYTCKLISANQYDADVDVFLCHESSKQQKRTAFKNLHYQSQHAVKNAFRDIDMGNNPNGIFGATPHDPMHMFLEGVLKYSTKLFINLYLPKEKAEIDLFVDHIFGKHCSSEKQNMLRTNFTKGITNLTMLTADEQAGIALTILLVTQMDKGKKILDRQFSRHKIAALEEEDVSSQTSSCDSNGEYQLLGNCCYADFVELMEVFLSFHAWYKSSEEIPWNARSKDILHTSIVKMLEMIKKVLP